MGDPVKQVQCNNLVSEVKALSSVLKTRRTKLFAYGFFFTFIACTAFLAFCPSGNAFPWFNTLLSSSSSSASASTSTSQFSSFFSYFLPNTSLDTTTSSPGSRVPVDDGRGDGVVGKDSGDGSKKDDALEVKTQGGSRVTEKSEGEEKVSSENGVLEGKNQSRSGVTGNRGGREAAGPKKGGDLVNKNQTVSGITGNSSGGEAAGPEKGGDLVTKNLTGSGVGLQGTRVPANNQTVTVVPEVSSSKKGAILEARNHSNNGLREKNITGNGAPPPKKSSKVDSVSRSSNQQPRVGSKENAAPETVPRQSGTSAKAIPNLNASLKKKKNESSTLDSNDNAGRKEDDWIKSLIACDIYHGRWVKDESYPLYQEGSCPHIDEPFDCYLNGRPDRAYQNLKWQPNDCNIPRLNATDMLERLRGKRLVFVGDSLNRNMWESLVCALRNSVKDKRKVFEMSGRREFRTEGSYSFLFKDYGCTIEFFRSPFLVQEWEMPESNGHKKETLRLDLIERSSSKYKDAHVIIFNTGHWWTHEKTSKGKDYYQEGNRVYGELNVVEAYHKALITWAKWVDANVNPKKTLVFFRGYSASHFSGGQWNSGGACDKETEPIRNETHLRAYPPKMSVLEAVLKEMKTPVSYLNITRMTDFRKDAHPSVYRKQNLTEEERRSPERYQDCSHWCLPGVPDSWNELLYAQLLIKLYQQKHS